MMASQFARISRKDGNIFKDNRVQAPMLLKDGHEAIATLKDKKHHPTCKVRIYLQHACFPSKYVPENSQGCQKDIRPRAATSLF
jgi:hypothetical protein